jgi:cyclophilin family peptidyl-prolyl cis-trans isomerase
MIRFKTSLGDFTVELFAKEAPVSAANFEQYVDDGKPRAVEGGGSGKAAPRN